MASETVPQQAAPKHLPWRRTAPGTASLALFALVALALLAATYLIFSTVRAERAERVQIGRAHV